jgi:serralysin
MRFYDRSVVAGAESSTIHGDLRFGMTDKVSTGWAYGPSYSGTGGDAWFNNSAARYDNPVKGGYAGYIFLHEIGYTLGLDHAHGGEGSGNMTFAHDSVEYSVMSYKSYAGASTSALTNETWGYPRTWMMYDIAVLQAMYDADFTTNGGNTTYKCSPTTGEMFVNGVGQGCRAAS